MTCYCTSCGEVSRKKNDSCFVCESGHENWINPAVGATVFVVKENKVLYGVRSREPGKGKLDLPGGFIEVNESAEQAAIRETREELGIEIDLVTLLGTYPTTYEDRPILNLAFIADTASEYVVPGDDMNGGEPVWRTVERLTRSRRASC